MGSKQSTVRSAQYQNPSLPPDEIPEEPPEEHHISISNKMVERLVEDATLASGATTTPPTPHKGDYKEKMYIERLKCLDETHSERTGLTLEDLQSLATRVDMRTANLPSVDPVCGDFKEKVIECYNTNVTPEDNYKCWDVVTEFRSCVQEEGRTRLHARTVREAREVARRSRHVALAREHDLRDLPQPHQPPV